MWQVPYTLAGTPCFAQRDTYMIRKALIWAIVGLLACAGMASESQASLVPGALGQTTTVGTPGGNVTVNWAVFDKDGGFYGTGNAAVEGAFVGGSNFLYVYQVTSDNAFITQVTLGNILGLLATAPAVVDDVLLDGTTGTFAAGSTRATTASELGVIVRAQINEASPPSASAVFGFTSAYGPELIGTLAAQTDSTFGNVIFTVDIPSPTSEIPPPVPEPGTLLMSALALVGGGFAWRRRTVVA